MLPSLSRPACLPGSSRPAHQQRCSARPLPGKAAQHTTRRRLNAHSLAIAISPDCFQPPGGCPTRLSRRQAARLWFVRLSRQARLLM